MVGIYSITSPIGKVYVGQSWNIKKRHYYYTNAHNCREQVGLSRSIAKHGWNNHNVKVLAELPEDITQKALDEHEIFCIDQFRAANIAMLNMKDGGSHGRQSAESIRKTQEARKKQPPPTLGKKFSEESKKRMSAWQIGRKMSPEAIEKVRIYNLGRKHTEQAKANMKAAQAQMNTWEGRKHKEESKQKQSLAKIGNKINNKKTKRIDTGEIFDSLIDAANSIGIKAATLSARIRNNVNIDPKFTFDV